MQPILTIGIIIFVGFIFGEIATKIKLPKVTGYILAGILLNPEISKIIPQNFLEHTNFVTNISLAFITFSVGGTLYFPKVKKMGKRIVLITLFEAEFAFFSIIAVFLLLAPILLNMLNATYSLIFIPLSLLLGSLASPTDPSATLAVEHEYKAKGEVTSTIMSVAAFDDILGIINYSIAVAVAGIFILNQSFSFNSISQPLIDIFGGILLGTAFSLFFNWLTKFIEKETEGIFIVVIFSLLALCYSAADYLGADKLLSTMTMGAVVVNYNEKQKMIFGMIERYTEELIFVLFFTVSSMQLNLSVLLSNYLLIFIFVIFRAIGKFLGTSLAATISKAPAKVKKYAAGGLIPQGGIVIGLALLLKQNPEFDSISLIIINIIIGATTIHEIIGPISAKIALRKSKEIQTKN
jgi:Kef-type K+ transport system membrane component KefB